MATSNIVLRIVFGTADVLLVKVDRLDWLLCGNARTFLTSSCCVVFGVLLRCGCPFLLLGIMIRLEQKSVKIVSLMKIE